MQIKHFTANNSTTTFASLPLLISLLGSMALFPSIASAEDVEYQVQSGDSLSRIIAKNYPDVSRSSYGAIMQHVLKNNPSAFANENINSLRLGKTLILTDKENIEGLKPAPPKPVPVNPEEFKKLQSQNTALEEQLQALKSKLDSVGSSPATSQDTDSATTSTENTSPETGSQNQEQLSALQAKIDELTALNEKLTSEKSTQETTLNTAQARIAELTEQNTKQEEASTSETNDKLAGLQAEIEALKSQLATATDGQATQQANASSALEASNKQLEEAKAEAEKLKAQLAEATAGQATEQANASTALATSNKQLEEAKAEAEKLRASIAEYETKQKASETSIAEANQKAEALQAEAETLRASVSEYEAEKANSTATDNSAAQQNEELTTELEQLRALVDKYEAEQKDSTNTSPSSDGSEQQSSEDLQFQVDQLQALVTKYEAELDEASGSTGSEGSGATAGGNTSELEKENSLLKAELEKARNKASEDKQTIDSLQSSGATTNTTQAAPANNTGTTNSTTSAPEKKTSSWLTLSMLSWLLPLLAILIGLYLLSRLLKRKRDREATQNLKKAMSSSAATSTADAFGVDGSLLPSTTKTDGHAIADSAETDEDPTTTATAEVVEEEDSVDANLKINMAKAYIELGDTDAANEMLQEASVEGSTSQKEIADKLQS